MIMTDAFTLRIDDAGIARIVFDLPGAKVNKLTSDAMAEFRDLIAELRNTAGIKAMALLSGKKNIFIAGADIDEIADISDPDDGARKATLGQTILNEVSTLPFPTIAAIDGACLGGGLELALACRYRIATENSRTSIGLPEVTLGIIPGFGGTQRLPRLIGLRKSLALILTGKPVHSRKALKYHIVDACVPTEFLDQKIDSFIADLQSGRIDSSPERHPRARTSWLLDRNPIAASVILSAARRSIIRTSGTFYPAPLLALDVIRKTRGLSLEKGLAVEARDFGKLAAGMVSKNLVKLFFIRERLKKDNGVAGDAGETSAVRSAGVVGAGVMGGAVSWLLTKAEIPVRLRDLNWDAVGKGFASAAGIYATLRKRGKYDAREVNLRMHKLTGTIDYSGFQDLDIVIEAVSEDPGIKQIVFHELETATRPDAIIASNTSTLSITEMARALVHPERFIGMHFFNPANRMPLVEVIPGEQTAPATVAAVVKLTKTLGKTPVVVKSTPGFLVNRLLLPYLNEAFYLLEDGVAPKRIEDITRRFGMPMGPFTLTDTVGIDIGCKAAGILENAFGDRMSVAPILRRIYEEGDILGRKNNNGIFLYRKDHKPLLNPAVTAIIEAAVRAKPESAPLGDDDIANRMLFTMINEASRCIEEAVVANADYLNMAMILGTGFPAFRGGPLRHADSVGTGSILRALTTWSDAAGVRFEPSAMLRTLGKADLPFHKS